MKTYWEEHPEIVKIFDDLDSYRYFCQTYGFTFDEKDLYNTKSKIWQLYLDPSKLRKPRRFGNKRRMH